MAKKVVSDYKGMKIEELKNELVKLNSELSKASWDKSIGKLNSTKLIKRKIAKIMTEINSR